MNRHTFLLFIVLCFPLAVIGKGNVVLKSCDFGLNANDSLQEASQYINLMCDSAKTLSQKGVNVTIKLEKGKYYFRPEEYNQHVYYISNHDQSNPKHVGINIKNVNNITFDGCGAELLFHGQMLPFALSDSRNCTLKDFSIDFPVPHIAQAEIVSNDYNGSVKYKMAVWDNWSIEDDALVTKGLGWKYHADYAIAFDGTTRHIIPQTSDLYVHTRNVSLEDNGVISVSDWKDCTLNPGTRLALRTWDRPAPAIFLANNVNTSIKNIKVHYAEGMGLLAQMCEDIELDGFSVCLKGKDDPRYFTTQADATHFSGCKGLIYEHDGLYEAMMDDAINVHGTYLKIASVEDANTVIGKYMHEQTYGFGWGESGDSIRIVKSNTMEYEDYYSTIQSITPLDSDMSNGVKTFRIVLKNPLPEYINEIEGYGLENITWTPEVIFENNIIRNNRARGALFSTPRSVVVKNNLFDHTSGCAILLCGDCNGWYETGSCNDVLITRNKFVNALTNMFQFTNAVISIYPEIPNLVNQKKYFHKNIRIIDNDFETFDYPLLYAKSVDGLIFCNNRIKYNKDFQPFHKIQKTISFERVCNAKVDNNSITSKFRILDKISQ